jgi:hypothetical protein
MSQSEITSEENDVADDDIAKKRNPFAKKMKPVASPQPSLTNPNSFNPRSCGMSDSGFCSQSAAVEISSSQLSVCSIDTDQVGFCFYRFLGCSMNECSSLHLITRNCSSLGFLPL